MDRLPRSNQIKGSLITQRLMAQARGELPSSPGAMDDAERQKYKYEMVEAAQLRERLAQKAEIQRLKAEQKADRARKREYQVKAKLSKRHKDGQDTASWVAKG